MANFLDSWRGGGTGRGAYILGSNSVAQIPLTLQLYAAQVANGFEIKSSAGTVVFSVSPSGDVTYLGDEIISDSLTVNGNILGHGTLTIDGVSTLTGAILVGSTMNVSGLATFNQGINVTGNSTIEGTTTIHSLFVEGDLTLESGYLRSRYSANLYLYPSPSTITVVGATNATSHTLNTNSDMFITGKLEVDGVLYADGGMGLGDNDYLYFGDSNDAGIGWNTAQTVDGWYFGTATGQNTMIIAEIGDIAYDFAHGAQTNPTLFIQSATQSATQFSKLTAGGLSFGLPLAITATEYSIGRNADAVNIFQWNVPTGAGFEISINDVTVQQINSDKTSVYGSVGTYTLGTNGGAFSIAPIFTAENFAHAALILSPTQNGTNTSSLIGASIGMTKATALTTLAFMAGLSFDTPVVAGTVTESWAIDISDQTNANITKSRGIVFAGTGAPNSIVFGDSPMMYSSGAEVLNFMDSTAARGITMTLTAAGTQTIGTNAGTLTLSPNTAQVLYPDGTQGAPSIAFSTVPAMGFYIGLSDNGSIRASVANWLSMTIGDYTPLTLLQKTSVSGAYKVLSVTSAATTGQTASTEINGVLYNLSATRQWATGAITAQREFLIQAPTYAFVGASTITSAATLAISGAPSAGVSATITDSDALWLQAGKLRMEDHVWFNTGVAVTAAKYSIGRDADATNQMHFNVPTGAGYEWSVQDTAIMTLGTTGNLGLTGQINGVTAAGASLDIVPTTGKYLRVGDATTTSHTLNANDDLEVTGELEVDGDLFADGRIYASGNGIGIAASGYISFATTPDDASSGFYEVTTGNPNLNLWLGTTLRRSLVIGDGVSRGGNYDHAAQNNPTIYLHSTQNPEGDNRQFVKWYNDGSNSYHLTGIGGHRFGFESVIANGIITFTTNPSLLDGDGRVVFTVNTGTLTSVIGAPAANQFQVKSTLALTLAEIATRYNLIAGTGVTAHVYGNSMVFEASTAGTTANAYVTTETTDTDGVYSFNSVMTFTANPSTTSGVVFTIGTGTLTGVVGAPGANQFAIGSTLQDTILNLVTAYNNLATGVSAISYDNSIQFVGGTSGISVFTETTDTDNVYSFVATTMHGGREFSAVFEMQPTALAIPATGTATAGTTTYNSATFTTRASGWDADDSRARDASVRFYAVPSTGASVGVTAYWDFYRDGVLVNNAMNLTGGGALQIGGALYVTGAISGATTLGMAGDLTDYEATNDGSPQFILGSSAAEQLSIQTVYNAGAQTLNYVQFQTTTAGAAGKGIYKFGVDGTDIMTIVNGGITVTNALTGTGIDLNITSTAYTTLVGSLDVVRSGAITGVIGETMIDVSIAPNFVLTEPGAGIFTYAGMSINMANVAVTAGAGGAIVTALYLNASTDADATSNNALYAVGNSIFNGNVGIGAQPFSWGANSATVFAIANGTPPAAHVDNEIQIYSVDSSDATSTLGLMLEQAVEDIGIFTATHKVKILVNGVEYWMQLDAVA